MSSPEKSRIEEKFRIYVCLCIILHLSLLIANHNYLCCGKMQVVYGRGVSDEFDRQGLSAMIDYWISPAAVKREFEASKSMCFCFCLIFILVTFLTMVLYRLLIVFSTYFVLRSFFHSQVQTTISFIQ